MARKQSQSSSRRRSGNARRPAPQGYRMSERAIRRWTRALIWTIVISCGIGGAISILGGVIHDDDIIHLGLGVAVLGMFVALVLAAYMGGQTLARFGGLVGLVLIAGMILGLAGDDLIGPGAHWLGIALAILAVVGFFAMGLRRRVPMWIAGIPVGRRPKAGKKSDHGSGSPS